MFLSANSYFYLHLLIFHWIFGHIFLLVGIPTNFDCVLDILNGALLCLDFLFFKEHWILFWETIKLILVHCDPFKAYFQTFFFNAYLFIFEKEWEHNRGGGAERDTQTMKQAPGSELSVQSPMWGLNWQTTRSWPEWKMGVEATDFQR